MPVFRIPREIVFPDPADAEVEPNGLLGVGGDLSPARLLLAYRSGIFPWYSRGQPILWWSPDPRMVLYPDRLHVPRRLATDLRHNRFDVTLDRAFADVIAGCAQTPRPSQPGTWITPAMRKAYCRLHDLGHAHSCEAWLGGQLAGGVYGVAAGRCFAAESMFYRRANASKAALVCLVRQLGRWGFRLVDCQVYTDNIARFGGVEIPRSRYLAELAAAIDQPGVPGPWQFDV
ncbi:MAG: leucyl/phenylalanyl-tRNA--protein transferase [Phycisphaerae bacterium]|nr:leucyl/phenylalanyl-tRNA--protein transferase [Phycisphaerae bacterium]